MSYEARRMSTYIVPSSGTAVPLPCEESLYFRVLTSPLPHKAILFSKLPLTFSVLSHGLGDFSCLVFSRQVCAPLFPLPLSGFHLLPEIVSIKQPSIYVHDRLKPLRAI